MEFTRARSDTPAADALTFLHSAGASLMPAPVVLAMREYQDQEIRLGGYLAAERGAAELDALYQNIGRLINASADEVAFMPSATMAWQMAFYSLPLARGDVVLSCEAEYGANFVAFLHLQKTRGIEIRVVPSDPATGELDLQAMRAMMDERVKLISLTWVPTNGGLVNPAAEVGAIARQYGVPYLLDACQAVGQLPVDVQALGCDMLAATGRKFLRGPRGSGFLYVRREFMDRLPPHTLDHSSARWASRDVYSLREDARRYENWESSHEARIGLSAAIDYALGFGIDAIAARNASLARRLRLSLGRMKGVTLRDLGNNPCAIATFSFDTLGAQDFVRDAVENDIIIGASLPASTRLDAERRNLPPVVRASPHYFNTEDDIDRLLAFIRSRLT